MMTPEEFLENKGWHKESKIVGGAFWLDMVAILKEYTEEVKRSETLPINSEWISVDERLPEDSEKVLTFTPDSEDPYQLQRLITFGIRQSGFPVGVTHWKQLPEPPNQ